jgi:ABC-2 type transport system ATP-binding protein/lipopolysaccharide transport system ATP-binding protein
VTQVILRNVSVTFPVATLKAKSLRANLLFFGSAGALEKDARGVVTITALRQINFRAETGDRIALIGRNGSGKTTMLKVIAGIYPPSEGSVFVEGRVSPVLGTGLGVDEELSGYEAIEYACLLRGVAPERIASLREDIADFTDLRSYLSVPVRTYSAGMKMRLGFAVATADEPDVLLIDEGIMAGDIFFMEKARERANRLLTTSRLLFLASHSEDMVRSTCNKAILLDSGDIVAAGAVDDVLQLYHRLEESPRPAAPGSAGPRVANDNETEAGSPGKPFSSSNVPRHPAEHALDETVRTHWLSDPARPVESTAFLGYDFGKDRKVEIRRVTLRQWSPDLAGSTCVTSAALQFSDDGFRNDVRTADTFEVEPTIAKQTFCTAPSAQARYWRLLAKSDTVGGREWGIMEFELDTAPPEYRQGGRAIGSTPAALNVPPEAAFEDNPFTHWTSREDQKQIKGTSWLGWDFGPEWKVEVRSFLLRQWDGGARPNTIPVVKVQSSNDGFLEDIQTADTVTLRQDTDRHTYGVAPSRNARFWRILADSTTEGGHWGVIELRFSERPVQDVALPLGTSRVADVS